MSKDNSDTTGDNTKDVEIGLKPYVFHGMDLTKRGKHYTGECPFCGTDGKFSVDVETTQWRCWSCGGGTEKGGGNALSFMRLLHSTASNQNLPSGEFVASVKDDRRLCNKSTITSWGVTRSPIPPHHWLIPGYSPDGKLDQLYKRTHILDKGIWKWLLLPTPGIWSEGKVHALHLPVEDFDVSRETIVICEGPWDGMALWEVHKEIPIFSSQGKQANIISVPGCNVWRDEWIKMCKGKDVVMLFDSDHPRLQGARAGYDGMKRIANRLSGHASSLRYIHWGDEGYDKSKPDGWDVRDELSGSPDELLPLKKRGEKLAKLFIKVLPVPNDWFISGGVHTEGKTHTSAIESRPCHTWKECESSWQDRMRWRQEMGDALAIMLAVCASTQQAGNQLFLDVVGSPGSGKTTICKGLLVSSHCHHLVHLTGFHSGWKPESGNDCSLISRINGKTLITPEFDVMRTSPRYAELMSQTRQIFDGESAATYKNSETDTLYNGLRTPWIRAGTPTSIMDSDQSQLGDRFLRFIISEPDESEKRKIMKSAFRSEMSAMLNRSNGTAGSIVDPKMRKAHALTGGYVDWLRANVEDRLPEIIRNVSQDIEDQCEDLADLCASLRARPHEDKKGQRKKESHDGQELPTRLTRQNGRLATHLAVVLNKKSIDKDVMRIVRKVALDTAHGTSLNIVRWLAQSVNPRLKKIYQESGGISTTMLSSWCNLTPERMTEYLIFLRKIGMIELRGGKSGDYWILRDRMYNLYKRIIGIK